MEHPGYDAALDMGYQLHSHSPNHSATYFRDKIALTVFINGEAEIHSQWKLVRLSTGRISFPHPRFELFERQVLQLLESVETQD